ncbi:hypothetical protein [Sphaerisporangium aureirubrum]|uniref:MacB-like periplasmic core domain-containing protein n=1 Tax=Sphaerisporangium aureirubrum TaxID=1544736 RepID=A0ABW1NN99_9ACTN
MASRISPGEGAAGDPAGGDRFGRVARNPFTWIAGLLAMVVGGVVAAWVPAGGHDMFNRVTGADPVVVFLVEEEWEDGDVAPARPIEDQDDRTTLLATSGEQAFTGLVKKYRGGPVGRLGVIVAVGGGHGDVRVVDIRPRVLPDAPSRGSAGLRTGACRCRRGAFRPRSRWWSCWPSRRRTPSTAQEPSASCRAREGRARVGEQRRVRVAKPGRVPTARAAVRWRPAVRCRGATGCRHRPGRTPARC